MTQHWREISEDNTADDSVSAPPPIPNSNFSSTPPPRLSRGCRRSLFLLFGYLFLLIAGGILLYKLLPTDVVNTIKNTYINPTLDESEKSSP